MSKELNVIDYPATEQADVLVTTELTNLDDLSLALVGGGQTTVCL